MIRKLALGFASLSLIACAATGSKSSLNSKLVLAAEQGRTQEVIALLKAGADLEARDAEGFTPYLAASSNGHLETMSLLKDLGARTMVDDRFMDAHFLAQTR
jgi:ankyrin repeat protein